MMGAQDVLHHMVPRVAGCHGEGTLCSERGSQVDRVLDEAMAPPSYAYPAPRDSDVDATGMQLFKHALELNKELN